MSAEAVRLFVGVPLSVASAESVTEAARAMKVAADRAGLEARWVPPVNYHITLKFLGWCRPEAVAAIRDAVAGALKGGPLEISPEGAGAFPAEDRGRVLWVGVDRAAGNRLSSLAEAVDRAAAPLGFERETPPFHPHITVARLKEVADVRPVVLAGAEQKHSPSAADAVLLYESRMSSAGSEYEPLARWPL